MSLRSTVRFFGRVLFCAFFTIGSAYAITAPPRLLTKGDALAHASMLDARVNLKKSYSHSLQARPGAATNGIAAQKPRSLVSLSAAASLKKSLPGVEIKYSSLTGAPVSLSNSAGWLAASPSSASSEQIVRQYLGNHADLFGLGKDDLADLVALGDSNGGSSGLRMLRIEQQVNGLPVFQSESRFLLSRDGRIAKYVGQLVSGAHSIAPDLSALTLRSPVQALADLFAFESKSIDEGSFTTTDSGTGRLKLTTNDTYFAGAVTARKVYFPLSPGVLVPAWSLVVFTMGDADWYAVVDAQTGDLLWRKNMRAYASAHDARFRVYVQADGVTPADNPAPIAKSSAATAPGFQAAAIAPTIVSMHTAMDPVASPNGWINDCPAGGCTASETQTAGNNTITCMDRVGGADADLCDSAASSVIDGSGRPTGNPDANGRNRDFLGTTPRDFQTNYLPPPQSGNPEMGQTATGNGSNGTLAVDQFRRGMLTHLFYVVNWYHDKLYQLGFDEPSGNFQQTNFSGTGLGGDPVDADGEDNQGTNNANFSTPPDGSPGRMQMYRFTGPTVDRDGALDAEISMHELTHGTSNRLIGNGTGLNWDTAGGMGEGWSDFYALSLLNSKNSSDPNARYAAGAYATYKLLSTYLDNYTYGIRRFPYSTDHAVNPLTWADVDDVTNSLSGSSLSPDPIGFNNNGGYEVHNIGEIWALTLWGVRARIIADPAGANGDVPTGSHTTLQLTTDAMKMTPSDPTFIDARNAILDADCATNACANEESIWDGFADRGLGYGAVAPYAIVGAFTGGHAALAESFLSPYLDVAAADTDVTIDDSAANNNGTLDPGEAVKLTVKLTNPWRNASKAVTGATATLSTTTPGVTIYKNTASYGAIAPAGSASADAFIVALDPSVTCGTAIDFTLVTVSNIGTTSTTFRKRVGSASGTDPVVTYTKVESPSLAIPDNYYRGVASSLTIGDDFQIAAIQYRIDSLTHTFTGDVSAMLRSPLTGGIDMIALVGGGVSGGGAGDNFTNTLLDDTQPFDAAHDLVEAANASAPFTGSWLPVYNSPWPNTLVGAPYAADTVGTLSRMAGQSTKGTWTTLVADEAAADTGTLNTWSILVTPVHFACTAFLPAATVTATKTVSGAFNVGGGVTYTVTITNNGTGNIADNAGHEFTDVLPASLTLVGATATSGTAVPSGNTVNWDGALAPLGGSVTITINATINSGTGGTTISSQGTVFFDADGNGTNESTQLTDDPSLGGATDPTSFVVATAPYVGLNPARLLDTRSGRPTVDGSGVGGGPIAGGTTINVALLGRGGVDPLDVKAVVLNITATNATSGGFITVWPAGDPRPAVSNINLKPGSDVSNSVVVGVGTGGMVSLFVSNSTAYVDLVVDVAGYFPTNSGLSLVAASRYLDTRVGGATIDTTFAGGGALGPHGTLDVTFAGRGSLPNSGLGAVIFNLTATNTTATGFSTAYQTGSTRPASSNLNFVAGSTVPNLVIGQVSAGGAVTIFNSAGNTDYIADVQAWFPTSGDFTPVTPARILDTRAGSTTIDGQFQAIGALGAGGTLDLTVTGRANVPVSGVGAVVLNVTVTQPTGMGFLQLWPTSATRPNSSNINFDPGQTRANLVIATVGTGGQVSIFNSHAGTTDVIADVVGWLPASP